MIGSFGVVLIAVIATASSGDPTPPEGFAFVVDESDAYVTDGDGAYVITEFA